MTQPSNNPPQKSTPTAPGRALRIARLLIVVGLCIGIGVFGVFTIRELEAGTRTSQPSTDFGASTTSPTETGQTQQTGPVPGLGGLDPNKFPPILRANPHPGQLAPFMRADPHSVPHYRRFEGGETWEISTYRVNNASLADLIAHYDAQARAVGMKLTKNNPTSERMPGGVEAAWSDGRRGLRVTGMPEPSRPAAPPLAPQTPLQWVVQYSYPTTGP